MLDYIFDGLAFISFNNLTKFLVAWVLQALDLSDTDVHVSNQLMQQNIHQSKCMQQPGDFC